MPVDDRSSAALGSAIQRRAGETGRDRRGPVPRAQAISSLGKDRGEAGIFLKWALLTDIVLFFRQFAIFTYILCRGPFWRLRPFSVRATRPGPPTSELISPGLIQRSLEVGYALRSTSVERPAILSSPPLQGAVSARLPLDAASERSMQHRPVRLPSGGDFRFRRGSRPALFCVIDGVSCRLKTGRRCAFSAIGKDWPSRDNF